MSGITSGIGIFSGINRDQIIGQLLAIEARPRDMAMARVQQLQLQQAAYLDLNSRLQALKTAGASFRVNKTFRSTTASSSDDKILTGTSGKSAPTGSYQFIVDRLVSTQQLLSRGFSDKDVSAVGATSFTVESTKGRLDRDLSLSDLNGADGVVRGKITITDSASNTATVDLSKAATVADVLDAINGNGVAKVTASVKDGKFVIKDTLGGALTVGNATGSTTATSLGIVGTATGTLTGSSVYYLSAASVLASLNDGNGVTVKSGIGATSFTIAVNGGAAVNVNLGDVYLLEGDVQVKKEGAVSTVAGALKRINDALTAAGHTTVSASVAADGTRLKITDTAGASTITVAEGNDRTAADLGILGTTATGTLTGKKVLAGINSTLAAGLNGGTGIAGNGQLQFTARDGFQFTLTISTDASLDEIASAVETASGTGANGLARISLSVGSKGTGLQVTDNTGGAGNLIVGGVGFDNTTATSLGIATADTGVAASTVSGTNIQHQYVGRATLVSDLNNGKGIGTGKFRIADSFGTIATIDIDSDTLTVGQLLDEINSVASALKIKAEINSTGDGIAVREDVTPGQEGTVKIKITDDTGSVARSLNIAGEASAVGAANKIDGSYERKIAFEATDTLQTVADKINAAGAGVTAAIIKDGTGSTPYRISLSSQASGRDGRFTLDTGSVDLGTRTLDAGENARVFFGSSDPANAVLLTSSSNTLDNAISGVKIDLKGTGLLPVTLTVATDTDGIVSEVNVLIKTFNTAIDRVDMQSSYNSDTKKGGPLLGDSTALQLRTALYQVVQAPARGITGRFERLADVGITVGQGGTLTLDEDRLRAALAEDPDGVEQLFAAQVASDDSTIDLGNGITATNPNAGSTYTSLGIGSQLEQLATKYLDAADGILTRRKTTLDAQIKSQNDRVTAFNTRLEQRRQILERQFLTMEQAIGRMQSQQGTLSQLG